MVEPQHVPDAPLDSTIDLLERFKQGDEHAVDALLQRSLPPLRRWARGRLPNWARSMAETNDLVQDAIIRALPHLKRFEARYPGALQAYLRQAVANHIRDEIRKTQRRPMDPNGVGEYVDPAPSPLDHAVGKQGVERYEAALAKLRPQDREAIVARIELQQSYDEVAIALGKPTANAARVAVTRAVASLIKVMAEDRRTAG
ncbi:MAG: sigma-70 family RNA polymerase sigma factor [Vicinamibacterales bacterium]